MHPHAGLVEKRVETLLEGYRPETSVMRSHAGRSIELRTDATR